jgi:uncharacterized protein with GYD domain
VANADFSDSTQSRKKERRLAMATFISLLNFTEKGIRGYQSSPGRADIFRSMAKNAGVRVKEIYWTIGSCDIVLVLEAPDDETIAALMLGLGAIGNVRSQTLRGFNASEMKDIITKVPSE